MGITPGGEIASETEIDGCVAADGAAIKIKDLDLQCRAEADVGGTDISIGGAYVDRGIRADHAPAIKNVKLDPTLSVDIARETIYGSIPGDVARVIGKGSAEELVGSSAGRAHVNGGIPADRSTITIINRKGGIAGSIESTCKPKIDGRAIADAAAGIGDRNAKRTDCSIGCGQVGGSDGDRSVRADIAPRIVHKLQIVMSTNTAGDSKVKDSASADGAAHAVVNGFVEVAGCRNATRVHCYRGVRADRSATAVIN